MATKLSRPATQADAGKVSKINEPTRTRVLWTPNRAFVG
jgi:hypothetical protein